LPSQMHCLHVAPTHPHPHTYTHSRYALFSELFQFGYFPELYNRTSLYADSYPSNPTRFPVLMSRYRDAEPVSPTQTTLLKLLDSFLHTVPSPFRDRGDVRTSLAGFLAAAFLLQAEYARHSVQQAIGDREPPPDRNAATDIRECSGDTAHSAIWSLDGRLPGVWVALVLLSTSLSSILLAEQEYQDNDGHGASAGPGAVTSSHGTVSDSRSPSGTGFIEELLGMMVPRISPS
jgi:ataxin-10